MNENLKVGNHYSHDFGEDISLNGVVLYNDGVSSILRVTSGNYECEHFALNYAEVQQYFPAFIDPEVDNRFGRTYYFCLDVETEEFLLFHEFDSEIILRNDYDNYGMCVSKPAVPEDFWAERANRKIQMKVNKPGVYRVGCTWEYIEDLYESHVPQCSRSEEYDDIAYVAITDRVTMQVCVIRKDNKYGVLTLDHTNGFGGPGVWCTPTLEPFPYDDVKFSSFPFADPNRDAFFAFRIKDKWGILKVVDGSNEEEGCFDVEYGLTKRHIVVPCQCDSLADAERQLGEEVDWQDPFSQKDN